MPPDQRSWELTRSPLAACTEVRGPSLGVGERVRVVEAVLTERAVEEAAVAMFEQSRPGLNWLVQTWATRCDYLNAARAALGAAGFRSGEGGGEDDG